MIYRNFGKLGWQVSAIGLGTWNIGNQWGEVDDATAFSTVRSAFEHGVNIYDSAESYGIPNGLSEERLGSALVGIRHRVIVVTKTGHWGERTGQGVPRNSVDMIRLCVHASLFRLKTDWLDVILCHESEIQNPDVYLAGFENLKQTGHIRAYGISTNNLSILKRFNVNHTCSVVQVDYSLLNRKPEEEFLPYCQENGIAVMVRGPLAQGLLSGKYSAQSTFSDSIRSRWNEGGNQREFFLRSIQAVEALSKHLSTTEKNLATIALKYVISHPVNPVAIPGAKSPQQSIANAEAGDSILTEPEIKKLISTMNNNTVIQ